MLTSNLKLSQNLLNLVPATSYFSNEDQQEVWGAERNPYKRKKETLSGMTVSQVGINEIKVNYSVIEAG